MYANVAEVEKWTAILRSYSITSCESRPATKPNGRHRIKKERQPDYSRLGRVKSMFKIDVKGNSAQIHTPYNGDFVRRMKNIGGARWNGKCWVIPSDAIDVCREIMREIYGRCDLDDGIKTIRLRLNFSEDVISETCGDVIILGKTVCRAYGRDSGGRPGDDVSFVKGKPESGGSFRNWYSIIPAGSVVVLSNVPEKLFSSFDCSSVPGLEIEIIDEEPERELLLKERERLIKRIAEIDALLSL